MYGKIIKKSFLNIINNPSITLFLVLFLIITNCFAPYIFSAKSMYTALILLLCTFLLACVFISGWFQVVKETIDDEKIREKNYWSIFLEGIGKNIISSTLAVIVLMVIFNLTLYLIRYFSIKVFGSVDFISQDLSKLTQDADAVAKYIQTLPTDKLYAIYGWMFSGIFAMSLLGFLLMFYMPSIIINEIENPFLRPFISLKNAICFVFKNFLGSISIYFTLTFLYFVMTLVNTFFVKHSLGLILFLFLYIYFMSFAIMLIFNYYGQKNCSDNGCDSIGENKTCNSAGEEN